LFLISHVLSCHLIKAALDARRAFAKTRLCRSSTRRDCLASPRISGRVCARRGRRRNGTARQLRNNSRRCNKTKTRLRPSSEIDIQTTFETRYRHVVHRWSASARAWVDNYFTLEETPPLKGELGMPNSSATRRDISPI
jgi:hypothetical protein